MANKSDNASRKKSAQKWITRKNEYFVVVVAEIHKQRSFIKEKQK